LNARPVSTGITHAQAHTLEALSVGDDEPSGRTLGEAELSERGLPILKHLMARLPTHSTVFDLGAGRGRHSLFALNCGHHVIAVERKGETFADLEKILHSKYLHHDLTLVQGDYLTLDPDVVGVANLVIATGMLQHAKDKAELITRLTHIKRLAGAPGASVFIEMLFDMKWDKKKPKGRVDISKSGFESLVNSIFELDGWTLHQVAGPIKRVQIFKNAYRSFIPPAGRIDVVSVEYLLT